MKHFRVQVDMDGEMVLAIESNSLCGLDVTPEIEECIHGAAVNLLSFLGRASEKGEAELPATDNTQMVPCRLYKRKGYSHAYCPMVSKCGVEPCLVAQHH